jgi:hypothetical protein
MSESKSELKRLCTLNPMEMADRIYELETQLANKTKETFQWIDEALRLGGLNALHVGEVRKLKERIVSIQDMFDDALQSDLEHGVKCLNENAAIEFHEKYPELAIALRRLSDME